MKRYIDAEKLIAEIGRRREKCADIAADERNEEVAEYYRGKEVAHDEIFHLIASLQQEPPGLPGIEESCIPGKDYIPVEWVDACERYGKWKIVKQEQPEKSKKDCNGCPHCVDRKDQYGWHFKGCFGGPYNGKFIAEIETCPLKLELPEVDLEKEIGLWISENENIHHGDKQMVWLIKEVARYFYELRLKARKEEKK